MATRFMTTQFICTQNLEVYILGHSIAILTLLQSHSATQFEEKTDWLQKHVDQVLTSI